MSPLTLVFVVDGLRPDAIDPEDTPTLHRLRAGGVSFADSHAVFPTVTRVNAATLATGAQPGTHGILGNTMYVPAVNPRRAFSTDDWRNLVTLDQAIGGRLVPVATLADRLAAQGRRFAAVGSGSTGSTFLLNPRAPRGVGVLVNGYFGHGGPATRTRAPAWPDADVNARILARFGAAPRERRERASASTRPSTGRETVLREYVLPELRPDVVINWITEPDHTQHALGAGSPDARASIRNADRHIGLILESVEAPNVFVASDHGFTVNVGTVDVARELIDAGLKAARGLGRRGRREQRPGDGPAREGPARWTACRRSSRSCSRARGSA